MTAIKNLEELAQKMYEAARTQYMADWNKPGGRINGGNFIDHDYQWADLPESVKKCWRAAAAAVAVQ